ncbi:MAG: GDP-mannose 4,6-dehydratase [Nanoarchaeota archaeon]|mgnify:CR=1 FL=1
MSKKVILTGVTGQAGSYFADYLLENTDYEIYGMTRRLSVKNHINIEHLKENTRFHLFSGDLNDSHSIFECIKNIMPDYFINCAAQSFVFESWISPANTMFINSVSIIHILEAIRQLNPKCRFVNFGSSEEWGDIVYSPQDEKHPPRARSIYGASKIAARQIIKVYRDSYGLYCLQSWCANYESPRRGIEFVTRKITKGLADIYHSIKNNRPIKAIELGNLDSKRDWSFCTDIINGIWRMINQEKFRNELKLSNDFSSKQIKEYVLSSNETHSIRDFCELAVKKSNIIDLWREKYKIEGEISLKWGPFYTEKDAYFACADDYTETFLCLIKTNSKFNRLADVEVLQGDSSLARTELNWQPKISFDELVERMVKSDIVNYGK